MLMARRPSITALGLKGWDQTANGNYYHSVVGVYVAAEHAAEVFPMLAAGKGDELILVDRKAINQTGTLYTTWWIKKPADLSRFAPQPAEPEQPTEPEN